ncbi:MAG: hypothetical protein A3I61_18210 [Acidobacteria bacterium RIFCSPLOWO2_02_FULL_68_18]|nr:MAG: hypothetical protein A3I61_18210 [Acidobacteria bacterium RIFCSPLOWO2_02_FULL_68_18]OFW49622.1 MAG: hypothetical protein A3G77_16260 [Acidobacteria bacterium RIFCSPLOWO2_12_FULL_68_19]
MLFPLLLAVVLLVPAAGSAFAQVGPTSAEAIQLANDGRSAEALASFQRLAAANPNDHEARLWIARLHDRLGHPDEAESVYRSVLLEDPANLDAALGVASTLLAREEAAETIELLEAIEERAPRNAEVLALLGRAHRLAGRTDRAIAYFRRAVAIAPTAEHRLRLEDARLSYLHRIETRGFTEQFSGSAPDSRNGDLTVNVRLSERLRILGRGQVQRKFAVSEQRGGGGVEWRWRRATSLRGHVLVGPDNLVMPEGDVLGELDYTFGQATWTATVRYFDFAGARTTFVSPAVSWRASARATWALRYAMSFTDSNRQTSYEIGHTAHVRAAYRLHRRLWLQTGYAAGVEDFDNFSSDRIGDFRASTVSGGFRLDLPTLTTVVGGYEHQWRRRNIDMGRMTVGLQQRF